MDNLGEVGRLAAALLEAQRAVEDAEARLKVLKERERKLEEEDLPGAMEEVGLQSVALPDGTKIAVKQEVYVAMLAANKPLCWQWLDDNGYGGLVKHELKAQFGRGEEEEEKLNAVLRAMSELGVEGEAKSDVNSQTLKAWLKEQLQDAEKAARVPLDLFGARPVQVAKVTLPKK